MLASLSKLKNLLDRPAHTFRVTTQLFTDLDVQATAASMNLVQLGKERGGQDQPPAAQTTLDAVEAEIIEKVASLQKDSQQQLEDELRAYRERLITLDFQKRFDDIGDLALDGLADLKVQQLKGLSDLHIARKDLLQAEDYLTNFRTQHRIMRPVKPPSAVASTLKWLVIVALFCAEMIANGYFLSTGAELGLVGGILEAVLFAALNVGVPVLIALKGLPFITHRNVVLRLWGLFWLAFFLVFTFILNLGLAHYREVGSVTSLADAGTKVMERILPNLTTENWPNLFLLNDLNSWILFGLGILFSVIALIDGFSMHERYPGLGEATKFRDDAREEYRYLYQSSLDDLSQTRQDYQDTISRVRHDLSLRRTEHDSIVSARSRLVTLFHAHQEQNQLAANAMLRAYRDSNVAARKTDAPDHFKEVYQLTRIPVQISREYEWNTEELKAEIEKAQANLGKVMEMLSEQFNIALASYRALDDLSPDK